MTLKDINLNIKKINHIIYQQPVTLEKAHLKELNLDF